MKFLLSLLVITKLAAFELDTDRDGQVDYWQVLDHTNTPVAWSRDRNNDGKQDQTSEWYDSQEEIIKEDNNFDGKFETLTRRKYHRDHLAEETVRQDRDGDGLYEWRIERTYLYSEKLVIESHYYDKEDGSTESVDHLAHPLRALEKR